MHTPLRPSCALVLLVAAYVLSLVRCILLLNTVPEFILPEFSAFDGAFFVTSIRKDLVFHPCAAVGLGGVHEQISFRAGSPCTLRTLRIYRRGQLYRCRLSRKTKSCETSSRGCVQIRAVQTPGNFVVGYDSTSDIVLRFRSAFLISTPISVKCQLLFLLKPTKPHPL